MISRLAWSSYQRRNPDAPWLTQQMIEFLKGYLKPTDVFVEFGSGRSTAWLARRVGRMISIEHHAEWHKEITGVLFQQKITNTQYICTADDPGSYIAAADATLAGVKPDLILIDGIHREHCAEWALRVIKPGGVILIDNVNWFLPWETFSPPKFGTHPGSRLEKWLNFDRVTRAWRRNWTSNNITDTAAFFAPVDWSGVSG